MIYDVAVVGAGPAGLICASELEKLGEKVIVIERDKKIGESVECAGLFSIDGLRKVGIREGDYILNEVIGARFIANGGSCEIKGKEKKAFVTDRKQFDRFLASRYSSELVTGNPVVGARTTKNGYELKTSKNGIEAKRVVLATGCNTSLHKFFGLTGPYKFFSSSQYEIKGVKTDQDFVELYVGSIAPGFFAWLIPVDVETARIGLGILDAENGVHEYMKLFLKRLKDEGRFKERNKIMYKSGGLIPVFDANLIVERNNAYLLGDAAGQVKATTGGGVVIGGLAAKELAKCIHNDTSYDTAITGIKKELSNHLLIRKVLNRFGDEQYGHMMDFLNRPEIKKLVEERGDMDFASPLLKGLIKNPVLMMQVMKLFGKDLVSGFF